jgi:hypothetical protein
MSGKREAGSGKREAGEMRGGRVICYQLSGDWGIIRQRTEIRGQRSEDRDQRTEDRGQEEELKNAGMFTL